MSDSTINTLIIVFGPIIGSLLSWWLMNLARKAGFDVSAAQKAELDQWVRDQILRLEELAREKKKLSGIETSGAFKQDEFVIKAAVERGISSEQALDLLRTELPKVRTELAVTAAAPSLAKQIDAVGRPA